MSDVKPTLNFGQVLVEFDSVEEHTAYVKHEYMVTWREYNAYLVSAAGEQRVALKNELDKARYDAYLAWKEGPPPDEAA